MSDTIRLVRIIKTPCGEAPQWVRKEWVGVVLPDLGPPENAVSYGAFTGTANHHEFGCQVRMSDAVRILAEKSPLAAQWWVRALGARIERGGIFIFRAEECEPLPSPPAQINNLPIQQILP